MGDECLSDDLVVLVQLNDTVTGDVQQEAGDVGREHLAGVVRDFRGQVGGAEDHDALSDHPLVRFAQLAVSTTFGGQVDNHAAVIHPADGIGGDQDRRMPTGNRRGGDHHVTLGHHVGHQFPLPTIELLLHLLGVTPGVLGFGGLEIQFHELRSEALHLFTAGRTQVVGLDDSSQATGSGNCLQAGDSGTDHQDTGGCQGPRGGHQQREHPRKFVGGQQHGTVAGDRRHRAQDIHALGAGDSGNQFQGELVQATLGEFCDGGRMTQGITGADHVRAGRQQVEVRLAVFQIRSQGTDLEQDLDVTQGVPVCHHAGTGVGVVRVGVSGGVSGPLLDPDVETRLLQLGHVSRDQRHTALTGERLLEDTDFHGPANMFLTKRKTGISAVRDSTSTTLPGRPPTLLVAPFGDMVRNPWPFVNESHLTRDRQASVSALTA